MHIVCTKENLLKGIQAVYKAVGSKPILPILSNILFDCTQSENKLKLSATDLEIGVEVLIDTEVIKPGKITIPARALSDIISRLPESDIELKTDESNAETKLKCHRSKFNLKSLESDDFPVLPEVSEASSVKLSTELLVQGIKKTIFAASTDSTKSVLNGVNLNLSQNSLEMAATDGYRLAVKTLQTESLNEQGFSIIIPARASNEIMRLFGHLKDSTVKISKLANQLVFESDDKIFSTRLVDGQYPDYKRIIPSNLDIEIVLNRHEFLAAVDRVAAVSSSDKVNIIQLEIKNGLINLNSSTPEVGQGSESMETEYEGESLEINFNARFLLDVLKNFDGDQVRLLLGGSLSPCLVKGLDDDSYFCMIMPIRS